MARRRLHTQNRGFTLVEVAVVAAVVGIVAAMALPSYQSSLAKARRFEAVSALTRLQLAQESFRANHGSYALRLQALQGLGEAPQHYQLALVAPHASGYIARATSTRETALNGGCAELSLTVADGQARFGPSELCWNR